MYRRKFNIFLMRNFVKFIVFILTIILANFSHAQIVKFERVYGGNGYDYGHSVAQTFDNGYIVAGATTSFGSGSTDTYILKTDSLGVPQWQKTFGGINIDQAFSIIETADSGFVIAGYTNSFGHGGYDMFVIKTDRYGDTTWTKTYGGSDWDFAYSIQQTTDQGFIITGGTYSYGNGNEDMYLVKINAIGDTLWTKTYGGMNEEEAKSVKQTSDGGYILTGFSKSYGDINGDFYTVKTNNIGDTLWTQKYGGAEEDAAFDVLESYNGEFIIGGKTKSFGAGNFDDLVIKYSTTGLLTYNNTYGGTDDDGINSIVESNGGRLAMMGYTYSYGFGLGTSEFLLYIENPYNGFHSGTFGGNKMEKAFSINNTKDNGYIICGNSTSYSNLDHIYLVKTDSNGISSANVVNIVTNINLITQHDSDFKIFPNPADDNIYLSINNKPILNKDAFTICIIDVLGRLQHQEIISNINFLEPLKINLDGLIEGMYFVNIEGKGFYFSQKMIIQH